jgi:TonB family protein
MASFGARGTVPRMNIHGRVCFALCNALAAAGVAAQEPGSPPGGPENIYIPAQPVERSAPNYPTSALMDSLEGWVRVSFIISEEGEVIEPMIEDSSSSAFDESTLRAIRKWRYKPATRGGKPVEQSMVQTTIYYQLLDAKGASSHFVGKYRTAVRLIADKKLTEADSLLQALERGELNFYEEAWLWWLKYVYLESTGTAKPEALEEALRKALGSSPRKDDDYLLPDVFVSASRRLFMLRARSADLSGAVDVFKRLTASNTAKRSKLYKEAVASLEPTNDEIMRLVAGPQVLKQVARVDEHSYWVHRMLRRSFALGDVQGGKLDVIDVRCTLANRRFFSITENTVLKIPGTWGDCGVYIKGSEGTTFAFAEYPMDYSSTIDPAQIAPRKE